MAPTPITPDYVRMGSRICMVTWKRLFLVAFFCFLLVLIAGPSGVSHTTPDDLDSPNLSVPAPPSVLRRAASAVSKKLKSIAGVKTSKASTKKAIPGVMRPWCAPPPANTLGAAASWKPASLGSKDWPAPGEDSTFCDWADKTTTDVSFRVCTFPRETDTQVSAYIHKEGHWSGWKKSLVQEMLPIISSGETWSKISGRTLVLDVRRT